MFELKGTTVLVTGAGMGMGRLFALQAAREGAGHVVLWDIDGAALERVADEIRGHVQSIAGGIEDRERAGDDAQLANVNPAFTWVRLAQRIPVRITIDHLPAGVRLIPGQTATVVIHPRLDEPTAQRSLPW